MSSELIDRPEYLEQLIQNKDVDLTLSRTGSHSDLFRK